MLQPRRLEYAGQLPTIRGSVFVFLSYRIPPSRQREFSKRGYGVSVDGPPLLSPPLAKILKVLHPKTVAETLFSNEFYIEFSVLKERILQKICLRRAMDNSFYNRSMTD